MSRQDDSFKLLPSGGTLRQLNPADAPKGAVVLDGRQVVDMEMRVARSWKPEYEMWSIRYGPTILAASASLSGAIFTGLLRPKFLLRRAGMLSTFLPNIVLPTVTTVVAQYMFVLEHVLVGEMHEPMRAELRTMGLQVVSGWAQPLGLSLLACATTAKSCKTYPMPHWRDVRANIDLARRMIGSFHTTTYRLLLFNCVLAAVVARQQKKSVTKLWARMGGQDGEGEGEGENFKEDS